MNATTTPTPTVTPLNFESVPMTTTSTPAISAPVTTGFDFNALRLPAVSARSIFLRHGCLAITQGIQPVLID